MQDYNTDHPFDLTLSDEQQMTWDMLRKFAETELRPHARQAEEDGGPSNELLEKIKSLDPSGVFPNISFTPPTKSGADTKSEFFNISCNSEYVQSTL